MKKKTRIDDGNRCAFISLIHHYIRINIAYVWYSLFVGWNCFCGYIIVWNHCDWRNRFVATVAAAKFVLLSFSHTKYSIKKYYHHHNIQTKIAVLCTCEVCLCIYRSTFMQRNRIICIHYSSFDYIALRFLFQCSNFNTYLLLSSKKEATWSSCEFLFFIVCNLRALCLFGWIVLSVFL